MKRKSLALLIGMILAGRPVPPEGSPHWQRIQRANRADVAGYALIKRGTN